MEFKGKDGKTYSFDFAHYGEERDLNATDGELAIADYIISRCPGAKVVRLSSDYVTVKYELSDIARFKYTDRTKWIRFPSPRNTGKLYFNDLSELGTFDDKIRESYEFLKEAFAK